MQGWAVVDNTVGADWDNVQLSLVAGAPQSFIQPLSQPLYTRRAEIPIATEAQLTPQTHEAAEMKQDAAAQSRAGSSQRMRRPRLAAKMRAHGNARAMQADWRMWLRLRVKRMKFPASGDR